MENERLIHEFLDGTLDQSLEEQLFIMLSSNEELKNEFRQQMAIKNAIRQDTKAFTPRAGSEAAIFGALGLGATSAVAETPPPPVAPVPAQSLISKYSQGLIGGAVASVATVIIMLLFFNNFGNNDINDYNSSNSNVINSELIVPVVMSKENDDFNSNYLANDFRALTPETTLLRKGTNDNISQGFFSFPDNASMRLSPYSSNLPIEIVGYTDNYIAPQSLNYQRNYSSPVFPVNSGNPNKYKALNIILEFSGSTYNYSVPGEVMPSEKQMLNNFGANIFYKLNDEIKFGFGYKRENYYQRFIGLDDNGKVWEYEQQPNFQTFTLDFRYTPEFLDYGIFNPALHLSVGGNQAGPVGRAMLGSEIEVSPYFNLTAGIDYSILGFHHQKRFFTSDKYGFYIGTGVRF